MTNPNNDLRLPPTQHESEKPSPSFSYQIWFFDGLKAAMDGRLPLAHNRLKRERGKKIAQAYEAGYHVGQQIQQRNGDELPGTEKPFGRLLEANGDGWYVKGLLDAVMGFPPKNESVLRCRYGDEAANTYWDGYEVLAKAST